MKCQELITYLSDYIDQDLSEELRVEAHEHLATCDNCQVVLDTTQKMIVLCRKSESQVIPAERRSALFDRLQRALEGADDGTRAI
jgi:hypothetical protein